MRSVGLMARYPAATWHRCPGTEPAIRPTQVIFHTAVMRDLFGLEDYFCSGRSGGIESHFGVGGKWGTSPDQDGQVRQWRDTEEQADANRTANRRPDGTGAISVETCDNGPRSAADLEPWTTKQLAALISLGRWARERHGIPPRICRSPDDPGFGWHAMWDNTRFELADGSTPWTPSAGKVCPGAARIHQLKTIVFPAIFAGTEPEETPDMTDEQAAQLQAVHRRTNLIHDALVVPGTTSAEQSFNILFARIRHIEQQLQTLVDALGEVDPTPEPPPA